VVTGDGPRLIVIVGPIAAGKSTLAAEVALRLRARGESVAVVGLDSVADMALPTLDWAWAHEVHGQLVGAWLATPVRTVVAEGPGTPAELDHVRRYLPDGAGVLTVVLTTSYETALRRALGDAGRGLSKDPEFLRRTHGRFEDGLPDLAPDLLLDSGRDSPTTLAEHVVRALDARRAGPDST
jgi:hypothetical protein